MMLQRERYVLNGKVWLDAFDYIDKHVRKLSNKTFGDLKYYLNPIDVISDAYFVKKVDYLTLN